MRSAFRNAGYDRLLLLGRQIGSALKEVLTPRKSSLEAARSELFRNNIVLASWHLRRRRQPLIMRGNGLLWIVRPEAYSNDALPLSKHEADLLRFFQFRKEGVFLDIGAHVGSYTLRAARSGMIVHAWEPNSDTRRILKTNLRLNGLSAFVHPVALGDDHGFSNLSNMRGLSRIGPQGERVQMKRLDDYDISTASLVKIDVEGHEEKVLIGGLRTIERLKPRLIIETHDFTEYSHGLLSSADRCRVILSAIGYDIRGIRIRGQVYLVARAKESRR